MMMMKVMRVGRGMRMATAMATATVMRRLSIIDLYPFPFPIRQTYPT